MKHLLVLISLLAIGLVRGSDIPLGVRAPSPVGDNGSLSYSLAPNTDNSFQTGYWMMGLASGGISTRAYLAQASNFNSTDYAVSQNSAGATILNAKSGQNLLISNANTTKVTINTNSATFASGVPVTISDATASSTSGTGCLVLSGGLGAAGAVFAGGTISTAGNLVCTGNANRLALTGISTAFQSMGSGVGIYRSGGTITTNAGDMVIGTGDSATRDFYFAAGTTTANVASINGTTGTYSALIAGGGISIKSGSNARCGTATLVGGTITVANTSVTANTRIMVTVSTAGGTQGFLRTSKSAGVSFTVTSTSGTETSTVDWELIENP